MGESTPDDQVPAPADLGIGRLLGHVRDAVVVADAKGRIVVWNRAAEAIFGYTEAEALRLDVRVLVPERYLRRHEEGMDHYRRTGHGRLVETGAVLDLPALHKEGHEVRVEMSLSPLEHAGEHYSLAILRDVTPRYQLAEELKGQRTLTRSLAALARLALELGRAVELEEIYASMRAFVEGLTRANGMFISRYDPATRMRTCVYAYSEGAEVDASTLPPMPLTDSPHSRAVASGEIVVTDDFDAAMQGQPRVDVGIERDPRRPRSSVVVPLVHHGDVIGAAEIQSVEPAAFTEEDVTVLQMAANLVAIAMENVRLYQDARTRATSLERTVEERTRELARKNRELEAFGYTVAHDLRAPLRAVEHLSRTLLEDEASLSSESQASLVAMTSSVQRMASLIDDLLALSRSSHVDLRRKDVDISAMAEEIGRELRARDPTREARIEVQPGLRAHADEGLTRLLLENLMRNAWKYSRKKPTTHIEVGGRHVDGKQAFFVRDEGVGFDATKKDQLFVAFQRLHAANEYEGTGIGLATVERIARHHGGRAWAEGELGRGATFWFTLGK